MSFFALCCFFLSLFLRSVSCLGTEAADSLQIQNTVPVGTTVQITANAQLYNGATDGVSFVRVYLAAAADASRVSAGPNLLHAQCKLLRKSSQTVLIFCAGKLIDAIPLCDEHITIYNDHINYDNFTFSVTIPESVGPAGRNYAISTQIFLSSRTNGRRGQYSGGIPSNIFELTGATGNWSMTQLADQTLWTPDGIPCTSFACVKACADKARTAYLNGSNTNGTVKYQTCANACPGVNVFEETDNNPATTAITDQQSATVCPLATKTAAKTTTSPISSQRIVTGTSSSLSFPTSTKAAASSIIIPPISYMFAVLLLAWATHLNV